MENPEEGIATMLGTFREVFGRPAVGIIDAVLIFFEYGDFLGKALPSGEWEEFTKSLAILSAISWYWKIIILLAVNLIILFVGSFKAIRKREIQRDSYRERLTPKFKVEKIIAQRTETENRNIVSIYLQVVPECLSDSPVYECQARMLLVSKQDGNEKWIPTEMNSPLKVGWDYYGYEPLTIQKGIAQRLDICYWDNRFVAVVPTVDPLPSKWRSIIGPGPFKFDIRMTAKDCSPVDFSVIVNLLGRKWDDPEYFIDLGGS